MPTLEETLTTAVADAEDAAAKLKAIINGPATGETSMVTTDGGPVKTVARAVVEVGDTSNQAIKDLSNVSDVDFTAKAATAGVGGGVDGVVAGAGIDVDVTDPANPVVTLADDSVSLAKMANGTAGNLISYDVLGDPVAVATGTAGQALLSQGAGLPPVMGNVSEVGGNLPANIVTLTTSGNYTPTPGTTRIKVKVIGGGGGGGASTGDTMAGMQGGAGAYAEKTYEVTDLTFPLAYTIGAKGIAVAGDLPPINRSIYK